MKDQRKRAISLVILIFTLFTSGFFILNSPPAMANSLKVKNLPSEMKSVEKKERYKSGELIIKIKPEKLNNYLMFNNIKVIKKSLNPGIVNIKVPGYLPVEEAIRIYENDPNIEYAHPNFLYDFSFVPNDEFYQDYQWNLKNIGAEEAWDISLGSPEITIAIVDSGVDLTHPDLKANLVAGWNFAYGNSLPQDDDGHGTHVAGIAAGITDNQIGIAGLAGKVKIMPIKVSGPWGIADIDVANGIRFAADKGANLINLSLGSYGDSPTVKDAIDYANAKGVLVIAAAGNDDIPYVQFPAAYSNVMAVSATDGYNNPASFSNYGPEIEVSAPGVGIPSTYWDSASSEYYAIMDGTSMATPLVSGLAALVWSRDPSLTNNQVRQIIRDAADDLGSQGLDWYYGYGKINAYKALLRTPTVTLDAIAIDKQSPQLINSSIKFTASASPGAYALYQFYVNDGTGWKVVQSYSTSNSFTWSPQKSGDYKISVYAKHSLSQKTVNAFKVINYKIETSKATLTQINLDKASPQNAGTNVNISAQSTSGTNALYQFYIHDGKGWTIVQPYSQANQYNWLPKQAGNYKIAVYVKDKASDKIVDDFKVLDYQIKTPVAALTNVTVDQVSPQAAGTSIRISAQSTSSSNALYQFYVHDGKSWSIAQPYSQLSSYTWLPKSDGSYKISIYVKDRYSDKYLDDLRIVNYEIKTPVALLTQVSTDKASPQPVGSNIRISAEATSGSSSLYQFYIHNGVGWTITQPYSELTSFNWQPNAIGNYKIAVYVKHKYSRNYVDDFKVWSYSIK